MARASRTTRLCPSATRRVTCPPHAPRSLFSGFGSELDSLIVPVTTVLDIVDFAPIVFILVMDRFQSNSMEGLDDLNRTHQWALNVRASLSKVSTISRSTRVDLNAAAPKLSNQTSLQSSAARSSTRFFLEPLLSSVEYLVEMLDGQRAKVYASPTAEGAPSKIRLASIRQ